MRDEDALMGPFERRLTSLLPAIGDEAVRPFDPLLIARAAATERRPLWIMPPFERRLPLLGWLVAGALIVLTAIGAMLASGVVRHRAVVGPIVFDRDGTLYVSDDGGSAHQIAYVGGGARLQPAWAPDESAFALIGPGDRLEIRRRDGQLLGTYQAKDALVNFAWSPDGRSLAVAELNVPTRSTSELTLIDRTGSVVGSIPLTGMRVAAIGWNGLMGWSPDGRQIAMPACSAGGSCKVAEDIRLVRTDGSTTWGSHDGGYGPAWSALGDLAWSRPCQAETAASCVPGIGLLDRDGSRRDIAMPSDRVGEPTWSRDGRSLAFLSFAHTDAPIGATDLFVQRDRSQPVRLTLRGIDGPGGLRWFDDGQSLIVGSFGLASAPNATCDLYRVDSVDGSIEKLLEDACSFDGWNHGG